MNISHSELVEKVKSGSDMTAFRQLVIAYQERIYFSIRRMAGSHEDTQDLVQETFIKSLKNIGQLKDSRKFGGWIHNIAVNLTLDFKRKKVNNGKISISDHVNPEALSDKLITKDKSESGEIRYAEIRKQVDLALLKLPVNHREAFILFHYHKLPAKQIAEYLSCTESTARSYVFRAVKKLKVYLQDYYEQIRK